MLALRDAALKGLGVVQLPLLMVCDQLANGSLVRVVPEWEARREIIHLVFPSRRGLLPSVRALVDYLAKEFAAIDED
jgi:DNA-binding transcriptional LysR family regulator